MFGIKLEFMFGRKIDRLLSLAREYAAANARAVLYEEQLRVLKASERSARDEAEAANLHVETLERTKSEQVGTIAELRRRVAELVGSQSILERTVGDRNQQITQLTTAKTAAETRAKTAEDDNKRLGRKANRLVIALVVVSLLLGGPLLGLLTGLIQPPGREATFSEAQIAQIEEIMRNTELSLNPQAMERLDRISQRMQDAAETAVLAELLRRDRVPLDATPEPQSLWLEFIEDYDVQQSPLQGGIFVDPDEQSIQYGWNGGGWRGYVKYRDFETVVFPDGNPIEGIYYVAELGYGSDNKIRKIVLSFDPVDRIRILPAE